MHSRISLTFTSDKVKSCIFRAYDSHLFDSTQEVHTVVLTQDLASAAAGPGSFLHLHGQVIS